MVWFETEFKSPGEGDWQAGNVYSHISEIMKSVSLAAIFWCILIPSSETSKENSGTQAGPAAVLPSYDNDYKREYDLMMSRHVTPFSLPAKLIIPKTGAQVNLKVLVDSGCSCNCLYVVDPMLVPSHDVEEYCQLCDCKSVESSDTAIKIILIVFLLVFVIILFFNIVLTIVKHFSHKPDAYTNSLHNEEESEDPCI